GIDPASMTDAAAIVGTLHYKPTSEGDVDGLSPKTVMALEIPPPGDAEKALEVLLEKCSKIVGLKQSIGCDRMMFVIDGTGIGNEQYARLRGKLPNLKKINIHGNSKDGVIRKKSEKDAYAWSKHDMILTKRRMRYLCKVTNQGAGPRLRDQIRDYKEREIPGTNGQLTGEGRPDDLLMAWLLSLAHIPSQGATYHPDAGRWLIPR